jgi:hypothetical protein
MLIMGIKYPPTPTKHSDKQWKRVCKKREKPVAKTPNLSTPGILQNSDW